MGIRQEQKTKLNEVAQKIERYCAYSERCRKDVELKLKQIGVKDVSGREKILKQMENSGFVNEARYARAFASDKFRLNKWGKQKIAHALKGKNIPAKYIGEALAAINATDYENTLKTLLRKKEKALRAIENDYERKHRLAQFLAGKGFEPEMTWRLLEMD